GADRQMNNVQLTQPVALLRWLNSQTDSWASRLADSSRITEETSSRNSLSCPSPSGPPCCCCKITILSYSSIHLLPVIRGHVVGAAA
uniref:Uncharacterized protein n=1 Tax=Maylandia zebra TaxID=106582 RepID=A0A3P9D0K6_9CICH